MGQTTGSRRRLPLRLSVVLALLLALVGAIRAWAAPVRSQLQTGSLSVQVTDAEGIALPGVTVTLTGQGAPQVQVTDATGACRFLNLPAGAYALAAALEGFGAAETTNLSILAGRTTPIALTLTASPMAEDAGPSPVATPALPLPAPAPPLPPPPAPLTLTASGPGTAPYTSTEVFRVLGRIEVCWEVTGTAPSGRLGVIDLSVFERGRSVPQEPQGKLEGKSGSGCTSVDLPPSTYYIFVLSDFGTSWRLSVRPG